MSKRPHPTVSAAHALSSLSPEHQTILSGYLEPCSFPAGACVVRQDARDRTMYLVESGQARVTRGGLEVRLLGPGDVFGELALVAGTPRSASVVASSALSLLRLTELGWRKLRSAHPRTALALDDGLLGALGEQLTSMTDSVGLLLEDRSFTKRAMVEIRTGDTVRSVPAGTRARDLLPERVDDRRVVAALIDEKASSLSTAISYNARVEPLTTAHWEGVRIWRQSVMLLLLEAAARVVPELEVRAGPTLGFAHRIEVRPNDVDLPELAAKIQAAMRTIVEEAHRLREELWTVDAAREHFRRAGWTDSVELLAMWREPMVPLAAYDQVYVLFLSPLAANTASLVDGFQVAFDEQGLLLVHDVPEGTGPSRPSEPANVSADRVVPPARAIAKQTHTMTTDQQRWLQTLGITSIGKFNRACVSGDVRELIRVSEGFQEKAIGKIADRISQLHPGLRIVLVAGPSSSGKTTFIKRLRVQLQVNGIRPIGLSLDDYYVDRDLTPRDDRGELDFEAFEALQVDLLERQVEAILAGQRVRTSRFDFTQGKSSPTDGPEVQLEPTDILLIEGIHGLNPRLLGHLGGATVFRVFICPLIQLPFDRLSRIHTSDVRLLRRIIRDRHSRGHGAASTILRWPSVRVGERRHIFPFQGEADAVFDSSLVYELSVLRVFAERYLLEVRHDSPAYTTAFRLLQLLDRSVSIYPDHVPPNSLLREFIGGSGFEGA